MPPSPTSAAAAFAGRTRIGSASAAFINASIAATTAPAHRRAAARRFLRREGLLDRLRETRIAFERHVVAREVAALVRGDRGARGHADRGGHEGPEQQFHEGSLRRASTSPPSVSPASPANPPCPLPPT